jgi:S1-C subfamily serine protease
LKAVGVLKGDVVVGIDGKELNGTMAQFLAYVRANYLVGDKVTLNVLRDGTKVALPMVLK